MRPRTSESFSNWELTVGKLRADVMAVNRRGELILIEVKSGQADLKADSKFHKYQPYCNKAYLMVTAEHWSTHEEYIRSRVPKGMGLIVCDGQYLKFIKGATHNKMEGAVKKDIVLRMAWRAATYSRRNLSNAQIKGRAPIC